MSSAKCKPAGSQVQARRLPSASRWARMCKPVGPHMEASGPACASRWARMWMPVGPHMEARINKKIRMHEITPHILMLSVFRWGLRRYGPAIL